MSKQEAKASHAGGVLADEMGLGKVHPMSLVCVMEMLTQYKIDRARYRINCQGSKRESEGQADIDRRTRFARQAMG